MRRIVVLGLRGFVLLSAVLIGEPLMANDPRYVFSDFDAGIAVKRAASGAARRLASQRCQQLMTEFADVHGQPLVRKLTAFGRTPSEYVTDLRFVEARDAPLCRWGATLAFTTPGRRIIQVCPAAFKRWYRDDARLVELIVIHEMLHSLGLGEKPPTSEAITARVATACG